MTLPGYTGFGRFFRVRRPHSSRTANCVLHTQGLSRVPPTCISPSAQYLTFCGFMAQLLLWPFAIVEDLVREESCTDFLAVGHTSLTRAVRVSFLTRVQLLLARHSGPRYTAFVAAVDDWACALVPTASSVTLLFYGLLFQDPRLVVEACVLMKWSLPSPNHSITFSNG